MNRPAFLVEHQVAGAERTRCAEPGIAYGNAPERPHGMRALQSDGRGRLSGSAHQCTPAPVVVLVPPVVVPPVVVPVVPPTALALSGVNRTS